METNPLIKTSYRPTPIPIRCFDWSAWVDGGNEEVSGQGKTEAEAIADLMEKLEE